MLLKFSPTLPVAEVSVKSVKLLSPEVSFISVEFVVLIGELEFCAVTVLDMSNTPPQIIVVAQFGLNCK